MWLTALGSRLVALGLLFAFCLSLPVSLQAAPATQTAVSPIRNEAILTFPSQVRFELELPAGHNIVQAELFYDVQKFSCIDVPARAPAELDGNLVSWTWVLSRSGNLPPGTSVDYWWVLTDAEGNETAVSPQTFTFTDDRYNWRIVEAENIRLHWYEGNQVGPTLLDASVDSLERLETEMGIRLEEPVDIYIYGSSADMRDAVLFVQEWAGGVAFTEFNTILMGVPPRIVDTWGVDVVPHELAHLVIAQYGRSCVGGSRPTWLDEGLAVYAEGPPDTETLADIRAGINDDAFEPLRSLSGSFAADHTQAGIAYSQSFSVVNYLLDTYGQEAMQTLLRRLAEGEPIDEALTAVYGLTTDTLESAWREAIGASARPIPPTPTPFAAAAVPTVALSGLPQTVPTPPAAAEPPPETAVPSPGLSVCGLGLILPLMMIGLGQRRGRKEERP